MYLNMILVLNQAYQLKTALLTLASHRWLDTRAGECKPSKAQYKGILEAMVCGILLFTWCFGPLAMREDESVHSMARAHAILG